MSNKTRTHKKCGGKVRRTKMTRCLVCKKCNTFLKEEDIKFISYHNFLKMEEEEDD